MKHYLFLGMMAALTVSSMQAQISTSTKAEDVLSKQDRSSVQVSTRPLQAVDMNNHSFRNMFKGESQIMWDFESDASFEGWATLDNDEDGYSWEIDETYGRDNSTCLTSRSYYGGSALTPDNWLFSPLVSLNGTLSMWIKNYMASFPDNITIYVCVGDSYNVDDYVAITDMLTPEAAWVEYTFDLNQYAGAEGRFAIRHHDCTDMFRIMVDDISISATVETPEAPVITMVEPTATTAYVEWEDAANAQWNLRYRPVVPEAEENLAWGFEQDTNENQNIELTDGWTSIDADGDTYGWYHLYGENFNNHNGKGHVTSASYMGGALTPDNWLVSPEVKLDGTLSFWAAGQDASWCGEHFAVYVSTGDPTDPNSFVQISEELVANADMTEYTFDLSNYAGELGYVAIRHYNVSDMFRLNVDDIAITYAPEAEWIYVNGIDTPNYTIAGLTPETTYEVEVQAVNADGVAGDWSEPAIFTTLSPISSVEEINVANEVNGAYYNMMGQKMDANNLPAGIYIHNGKKILVK